MSRQKHTISFRINDELAKLLDDAREPFGLSRHEWARGVLIAWLQRSEEAELNSELIDLRQDMERLLPAINQSLARHLFAMLTVGANVTTGDAKEVVKQIYPGS